VTVNGAIPLAKGIKEQNLSAKFMAPDGVIEQAFLDGAGDAAEGAYLTVVGLPPSALTGKGKEFVDNYKARFGKEAGTVSPLGYESAKVVLLAIERAGAKDRTKILEEVSKIKNYNGLFGMWSFDKNGDTTLDLISGNMVQNHTFVFEKLLTTK
jgi:branched-chain amino acid transport system substrate-binding protein